MESSDIYYKIIEETEKHQLRLTLNEFNGVEYLHLRRYYQDFDETWLPSKEGISVAIDFENCVNLFEGMAEILSLAESKEVIEKHFGDVIRTVYEA